MSEKRKGYFSTKHDTAANLTTENIILPDGVTGYEIDTQKSKRGDGATAWNDLDYVPMITPEQETAIATNTDKVTYPQTDSDKLATIAEDAEVNTIDTLVAGANVTLSQIGKEVTISASGGGGVDSVQGETGDVVLDTDDIGEGTTNEYYTEAKVSANTSVVANTDKRTYPQSDSDKLAEIEAKAQVNTLNDIVAGENVTIDKTDPLNPIIAITGGGSGGLSSKFKPLTIGYAGDSIAVQWSKNDGASGMFWFTNLFYPCNTINSFVSAVGGTQSSNLLVQEGVNPPQIDALELLSVKPELLIVHTTQNDFFGTYPQAEASALNVTTYCGRALASGVNNIIIVGHPPKDPQGLGTDEPSVLEYLNRILSGYADSTEGVHFIDVLSLWREIPTGEDPANSGIPWRSGYSDDGTHPTTKAMYEAGKLLQPILEPFVQSKTIQSTTASEYDDATAQYNNVLDLNGLMLGTKGHYNGVSNVNVAGTEDLPSISQWRVVDGNGVVATPAIVIDDDGYNRQQLVLSGTASANQTIILEYGFAKNPITLGNFIQEALLELNDIKGVDYIRYGIDNIDQFDIMSSGQELEGENKFHLTSLKSYFSDSYSTRKMSIMIRVLSGQSPTGTIKLGRCGLYRQAE